MVFLCLAGRRRRAGTSLMFRFTRSSFLSIASSDDPATAVVRSRIPQDITRLWPTAIVRTTPHRDYRYEAGIDRDAIAKALRAEVCQFIYSGWRPPHWYFWRLKDHERCLERSYSALGGVSLALP